MMNGGKGHHGGIVGGEFGRGEVEMPSPSLAELLQTFPQCSIGRDPARNGDMLES
jgi:hypothetical protein